MFVKARRGLKEAVDGRWRQPHKSLPRKLENKISTGKEWSSTAASRATEEGKKTEKKIEKEGDKETGSDIPSI